MQELVERGAGLDIGSRIVVGCVLTGAAGTKPAKHSRTFGTMTADLMELRTWLGEHRCTHVAMESTGVYWMPVYAMLEDEFAIVVGNAQRIKNVPGRKTDVKDSEWLADLLRHGLIASSFVPPKPIRLLRDLLRYRKRVVEARNSEKNRMIKILEQSNVKLASVASDVFGVSGTQMLRLIAAGETDPEKLADVARGRLRSKLRELARALEGRVEDHHRFLLRQQLRRLDHFESDLAELDGKIDYLLDPYRAEHKLLMQIPGVSWLIAAGIISEVGVDMSVFPTAQHLASWAALCPGNWESAGKRKNAPTRKGNIYLRTMLVQAAHAASKKKNSYYRAKFQRLRYRRGPRRAAVAVAHKIAVAVWHMLKSSVDYSELGERHLDQINTQRTARNLVRRLESLGYEVKIEKAA